MSSSTEHIPQSQGRLLARSLRSRNYRLFVAGQSVSLVGTWMQQVAMSWLVYRLTGSAMLLGVIGFTSQIPALFLAPVAGVLADRWDRRLLLLGVQALALLQATLLTVISFAGQVQVWQIIALSLLLGVVNGFDIPVRQSFVVDMVAQREDLGNAIALNSSMFNGARLLGPAMAGLLVATAGESFCFLLNSLSYLAIMAALVAMRITPPERTGPHKHVFHELRDGFGYAFGFGPIRSILLLIAWLSLLGMPYAVLMPIFAHQIFNGGAHTYGFLMTAVGAGSLFATLYLASRPNVLGLGRMIVRSSILFSAGIALFSLSRTLPVAVCALLVAGFGITTMFAACNTIIQTIVDEDKRGRVMSLYTIAFSGITPFGNLLAGSLAGSIGARQTVLLGGIASLAGAAFFAWQLPRIRARVRPIYERLGILPQVHPALEVVAHD